MKRFEFKKDGKEITANEAIELIDGVGFGECTGFDVLFFTLNEMINHPEADLTNPQSVQYDENNLDNQIEVKIIDVEDFEDLGYEKS